MLQSAGCYIHGNDREGICYHHALLDAAAASEQPSQQDTTSIAMCKRIFDFCLGQGVSESACSALLEDKSPTSSQPLRQFLGAPQRSRSTSPTAYWSATSHPNNCSISLPETAHGATPLKNSKRCWPRIVTCLWRFMCHLLLLVWIRWATSQRFFKTPSAGLPPPHRLKSLPVRKPIGRVSPKQRCQR